jgi:acyl dehydratase
MIFVTGGRNQVDGILKWAKFFPKPILQTEKLNSMTAPKIGDIFTHDITYTQEQVDLYAKISGDTNPLHVNPEVGKVSMFGRNIIHGHFSASVFTKIFGTLLYPDGQIYMKQSTTFLKPMFVDTPYQAVITVKEIFPEKNRVLFETKVIDKATGVETIVGEALLMNKTHYAW